jgi:SAM-dependent methyltransferase
MMSRIKIFNGSLFKSRRALPLDREEITELWIAAKRDWRDVEPAIFGTLLERALDPRERAKLGAHYTPRAYVERLVIPTIIEPLRSEWALVQGRVADLRKIGDAPAALPLVKDFHHKLCTVTVLDPACGTGNFLYVALELMKRLEGEVLDALDALGENQARLAIEGETVSPKQFFGLEINPRAVAIADLVLWIGYLKWQLRTTGLASITEPVINAYGTIVQQDAILAHDRQEILRDAAGRPISRWDGVTKKLHPITGEEIPDPDARIELYTYRNPRPAQWPEVDFIVGNPPFIGGKDMREELGDGYAEACWKARPHLPGGADFVMHFWDEAATRLLRKGTKAKPNPLRRFGFITTNSITQTFSRRVIERHLGAKEPLSLIYAIPDHPWLKASDRAAVRIAMTVAERGESEGVLAEVISEEGLNTDTPLVELEKRVGKVRANLSLGADLSSIKSLIGNDAVSSPGVKLHGAGFIVTPQKAAALGLGRIPGLEKHILDYRNGRDIAARPRGAKVIDLFPLSSEEVRDRFPEVYQHVLENVKPERDENNRASYRDNWWIFGEPRRELRPALAGLPRYITTIETAKHRFFQFLDASIRPDNRLVNIGVADACAISVLASRLHIAWTLRLGGQLEDRPIYTKSEVFDPFPFPVCIDPRLPDNHPQAPLRDRLRALGERLDAFRKERLAAHDFLTMTGLYNILERLRELESGASVEPLSASEKDIHEAGLVSVLKDIHDEIDRAVIEAYGFEDLGRELVGKPGATTPSAHKSASQEAAEEELLTRLVALNLERHAEEKRGLVRWLRPDFQIPKLGHKVAAPQGDQLFADLAVIEEAGKPKWPGDGLEQIRIVRDILVRAPSPALADAIAASFDGRTSPQRRARVSQVLESLVSMGMVRTGGDQGGQRYFVPR